MTTITFGNADSHGGLCFSGTSAAALQCVKDLRALIDGYPESLPNYIADFVVDFEVMLQNTGYLDEYFNDTEIATTKA